MKRTSIKIINDNLESVDAQAPVIVSASRSTDIPAFYADWFFHRLDKGYSAWTNPFNGKRLYVSYADTRLIVFWSKNPKPLLEHIDKLKTRDINTYVQFTLNDYVEEKLEKGVPVLQERIDTFRKLVDKLGTGKVIWRFDPLVITEKISVDDLLDKARNIGDRLKGYSEKLVFSFADIATYRKVKSNLEKATINYREFEERDMLYFASELQKLNSNWGYTLATCGEKVALEPFGVEHNKCIDDDLIVRLFSHDQKLMQFLGVEIQQDLFGDSATIIKKRNNKDKGQRIACGCIVSKDIGEYNTCPHLCEYCYANSSKSSAEENYRRHLMNPFSETITGK